MKKLYVLLFFVGVVAAFWYARQPKPQSPAPSQKKEAPEKNDEYSVEIPPKNSLKGKVVEQSGEVMWESRLATSAAEMLSTETIQQGEALKTKTDARIAVEFKKQAQVTLEPESEVSFVQTLPHSIVVKQRSGEVRYEKIGDSPVSVRVLGMLVIIDEGSSTIIFNEDFTITVVVNKGSSRVAYNDLEFVSTVHNLSEGDEFVYDNDTREGSIE